MHPGGTFEQVTVIDRLLFLAGTRAEFTGGGGPTGFGNDDPAVGQGLADRFEVGDSAGVRLADVFSLPRRA